MSMRAVESTGKVRIHARMPGVRSHPTESSHGRHRAQRRVERLCRDQNDDTTLERRIGTRKQKHVRLDLKRTRFDTDRPPERVFTVSVETMGTVHVGGSSASSAGMVLSSSACTAQPPNQQPSEGAMETTRESSAQQTGGDEMVDDQPSRKRPWFSDGRRR